MKIIPAATAPKFFLFDQNNSGGLYELNDSLTHYVFIEAASANEANAIAESIGIEFGVGCPCCGDRWNPVFDDDGMVSPLIYNRSVEQYDFNWSITAGDTYCRIYYLSGIVKEFIRQDPVAISVKFLHNTDT